MRKLTPDGIDRQVGLVCRALSATVFTLLTGCEPGIWSPAGPIAAGEKTMTLNALVIMLCIILPVIVLTIVFGWWFRAGNKRARYQPDFTYSGRLELLIWAVPALIVIFIGGIGWIGSHQYDPPKPLVSSVEPINVNVVALDWKWLFIYPDQGVASINRLVIPAGTPVSFRITSATVMNSFMIPQLGGQIYAMSGMTAKLHLMADRPGRYRGLSAHYSGRGFPGMAFMTDAVPRAQFANWVSNTKGSGPPLDGQHFMELMKDSENVKPYTYRAVLPQLFDRIVANSGTLSAKTAVDGREQ